LRLVAETEVALDGDPEAAWRARWRPFRCAGFAVRAEFHDPAALPHKPGDLPLILIAGSAFGTGGHATTRLALASVRKVARERAPGRWLDVGTGSGILAVAAALLGARFVAGMDPDPQSAPQALAMAERNGVAGRVAAWRGRLDSAAGQWPAIAGNLFADLPGDSAAAFAALLEPGGVLCAGGVVDRRWAPTAAALSAAGLRMLEARSRGRWISSLWERIHPIRAG
jgi:ribosomal protein L11 methyltransferase